MVSKVVCAFGLDDGFSMASAGCSSRRRSTLVALHSEQRLHSPLLCTDSKCHDALHASVDCPREILA